MPLLFRLRTGRTVMGSFAGIAIPTGQYSISRMRTAAGDNVWSRLHVDLTPLDSLILVARNRDNYEERLKQAGEIVREAAFRFAPVLTGWLREHIEARGRSEGNKVILEVGVDIGEVPYAAHQEWGTYRNKAHPYLRPAIDTTRYRVVNLLGRGISDDVLKKAGLGKKVGVQMDLPFGKI